MLFRSIYDNSEYKQKGLYILLAFDGYGFTELEALEIDGDNAKKRGVYIDGYLYAFGETANGFAVQRII